MEVTNQLFLWYFWGVGGIGGWILFFILAVIAIAYIIADSQWRKVPGAFIWVLGSILPILLIFPTILFRFAAPETQASMQGLRETFFYMGLMGGIIPVVVAAGYVVAHLGTGSTTQRVQITETDFLTPTSSDNWQPSSPAVAAASPRPPAASNRDSIASARPPAKKRALVHAWLINNDNGQSYQLYEGDTRIGRDSNNDISLKDSSVSREHTLIREDRGHFVIIDRGSKSGTLVNKKKIDASYQLAHGDTIEIGDLRLDFATSR